MYAVSSRFFEIQREKNNRDKIMLKARKLLIGILVLLFVIVNTSIIQAEEQCYVMTVTANVEYKDTWLLQWDPSNPDEINRNNSVLLKVKGGFPPYSWSVSGTGFSLEDDTTQGLSNTLYADNTACVATVSVTDSRGRIVSGDVRCSCGGWVNKGQICGLEGRYDTKYYSSWVSGYVYTKERGNQRQTQTAIRSYGSCDEEGVCESRCTANDGSGNLRCNKIYGCEACIAQYDYEAWCDASGYCWCTVHLQYYEYECPE